MLPRLLILCAAATSLLAQSQNTWRTFDYGFEQRVRNENWNNQFDFNGAADDERVQVRYRTRLWMRAAVAPTIDLHIGLAQETNQIVRPRTPAHMDEVVFETAYVDFKRVFSQRLSLKIGRQNLIRGEGFVLLEGDPYDGSRTIYSNAAVLAYTWKKSKLELIGSADPHTDRYLPRINDKHRPLIEWDEKALGFYYTSHDVKNTAIEAYSIYKRETGALARRPDSYVYTTGARAVRQLGHGYSLTGEFAGQRGHERCGRQLTGAGGYGYLKKTFGMEKRHNWIFGYWGMSGDDPATKDRKEGWNPIFSRWPKWSEMYLYTMLRESGVGYWTNVQMWQGEVNYVPWKPLALRGTYYRMDAFEPSGANPKLFAGGTGLGNLWQGRADLAVGQHWRGHLLWEQLLPGSHYAGKDLAYFLRFEVIYGLAGRQAF